MKEINSNTLLEFEKLLIQTGGVYEVKDDCTIVYTSNQQPVTVADGKKSVKVAFFYNGMSLPEDTIALNPFKETIGINRAREWFYNALGTLTALSLQALIAKLLKDTVEKNDDNYTQFPAMARIIDKVDEAMLEELNKIRSLDLLSIYYNKKTKTAEAQTCIFDEDYRKDHPKFRKKTWETLEILISTFLGTSEISETYTYTAKILSIPETDAKLHVIIGLLNAMDPWYRDLLGIDLHGNALDEHLEALEGYAKLYAFVTQPLATPTDNSITAPWNQNTPMAYNNQPSLVPASTYGLPAAPAAAVLVPTSSIDYNGNIGYNPYANGSMTLSSSAAGNLGVPAYPTKIEGYHL